MCHDHDSSPPAVPAGRRLPRLAGAAGAERLETTSADGSTVALALAETPQSTGAGIVILPDVRGLSPFYGELAERFASVGHHAIVVDYFGRTDPLPRADDFDAMAATATTKPEQVQEDLAAAIAVLRERTGTEAVVVVGFCFGGTNACLTAANPAIDAAGYVSFYGGLDPQRFGYPSPVDVAADMRGPILAHYGEADASIPAERISEFGAHLAGADVEHTFFSYPEAPHSFFDRRFAEHARACENAWERTLVFLDELEARAHATA